MEFISSSQVYVVALVSGLIFVILNSGNNLVNNLL